MINYMSSIRAMTLNDFKNIYSIEIISFVLFLRHILISFNGMHENEKQKSIKMMKKMAYWKKKRKSLESPLKKNKQDNVHPTHFRHTYTKLFRNLSLTPN